MNDTGKIEESSEVPRIATFGLGGCTATALIFEKRGQERIFLQHYDPWHQETGKVQLKKEVKEQVAEGGQIIGAIIMTPGEWQKNERDEKWEMIPKNNELVEEYFSSIGHAS